MQFGRSSSLLANARTLPNMQFLLFCYGEHFATSHVSAEKLWWFSAQFYSVAHCLPQATNFTRRSLNRVRRQFATCSWMLQEHSSDCRLVRASHAIILKNSERPPTSRALMRNCETSLSNSCRCCVCCLVFGNGTDGASGSPTKYIRQQFRSVFTCGSHHSKSGSRAVGRRNWQYGD